MATKPAVTSWEPPLEHCRYQWRSGHCIDMRTHFIALLLSDKPPTVMNPYAWSRSHPSASRAILWLAPVVAQHSRTCSNESPHRVTIRATPEFASTPDLGKQPSHFWYEAFASQTKCCTASKQVRSRTQNPETEATGANRFVSRAAHQVKRCYQPQYQIRVMIN